MATVVLLGTLDTKGHEYAYLRDRLLVMVHGEVALETTSAELLADEDAQRRYLGVEPTAA